MPNKYIYFEILDTKAGSEFRHQIRGYFVKESQGL